LVRSLLLSPAAIERVAERVTPEMLRNQQLRVIYTALIRLGPDASRTALVAELPPESAAEVDDLVAGGPTGADPARVIEDSLAALRVRALSDRLAEIDRLVALG